MSIHEKFGQAVATLRKEKGYSQERFAFEANIARKYMSDIENGKIQYEIDEMILYDIRQEEIPFAFMDGIAIQIESLLNPTFVESPIILIYPLKAEVMCNLKMCKDIAKYQGYSWSGSFYSIALKYAQIYNLS